MADITMPQLGETVTEGTITKWLKQVGDAVAEDDVLFEVSTDKVDSEVPSPVTGFISEILVAEGETVDVGTKLAVISDAPGSGGGAAPEADAEPEPPAAKAEAEPEAEPEPEPEPAPVKAAAPAKATAATPAKATAAARTEAPAKETDGGSKVLSPVVRRLIAEHGLDPATIEGSGAGGRITRDDILALIDRQGGPTGNGGATTTASPAGPAPAGSAPAAAAAAGPAPAPAAPAPAPAAAAGPAPTAPAPATSAPPAPADTVEASEDDTVVPFTNIRRRTAEHMVRSIHTSAHTVVAMEVDYSAVEKVRQAEKDRFKAHEGVSLTYLPFIARAVVDAIAEWPNINSSVGDDALIVHNRLNIGIAVDLNYEGLLVPVVHDAADKRLRALARDIASLADRARSKRLTMDDISGGTFTLTNAGPFGTLFTIPVINQPQVAILATDGIRKKPVVVESPDGDAIAIHPVGTLVLSFDHRAIDGAYASAFMRSVKQALENRDWSTEL